MVEKEFVGRDDTSELEEKCIVMQEAMKDFREDNENSIDKSKAITMPQKN